MPADISRVFCSRAAWLQRNGAGLLRKGRHTWEWERNQWVNWEIRVVEIAVPRACHPHSARLPHVCIARFFVREMLCLLYVAQVWKDSSLFLPFSHTLTLTWLSRECSYWRRVQKAQILLLCLMSSSLFLPLCSSSDASAELFPHGWTSDLCVVILSP